MMMMVHNITAILTVDSVNDDMTLLRASSDLLMFLASSKVSP